jgi:ribonuclease P protein component
LHRPDEFSAVLSARPVLRGDCFVLHFCHSQTGGVARLGLVVPKRLAKGANLRNAIKRQAREAFRLYVGQVPAFVAFDVVLRLSKPLKGVLARNKDQRMAWRLELDALLKRLGDRVK